MKATKLTILMLIVLSNSDLLSKDNTQGYQLCAAIKMLYEAKLEDIITTKDIIIKHLIDPHTNINVTDPDTGFTPLELLANNCAAIIITTRGPAITEHNRLTITIALEALNMLLDRQDLDVLGPIQTAYDNHRDTILAALTKAGIKAAYRVPTCQKTIICLLKKIVSRTIQNGHINPQIESALEKALGEGRDFSLAEFGTFARDLLRAPYIQQPGVLQNCAAEECRPMPALQAPRSRL